MVENRSNNTDIHTGTDTADSQLEYNACDAPHMLKIDKDEGLGIEDSNEQQDRFPCGKSLDDLKIATGQVGPWCLSPDGTITCTFFQGDPEEFKTPMSSDTPSLAT